MIIHIWRVTDSHGTRRDVAVVDNDEETVFVDGMKNREGEDVTFESKAYHLETWAEETGVTLERFRIEVNLDKMAARLRRAS